MCIQPRKVTVFDIFIAASIEILQKSTRTVNAKRKSETKLETAQIAEKNGKTSTYAKIRQDVSGVTTHDLQ